MFEFAVLPAPPTAAEIAREFAANRAAVVQTLGQDELSNKTLVHPEAKTQLTSIQPFNLRKYHQRILSPQYQAKEIKLEAQRKAQRKETITNLVDELYKAKTFVDSELREDLVQTLTILDTAIVQTPEGERITEIPEKFAQASSVLLATRFISTEELEGLIFNKNPIQGILRTLNLAAQFRDGLYEVLPEGLKPDQADHRDPEVNALYQRTVKDLRRKILPEFGIEP